MPYNSVKFIANCFFLERFLIAVIFPSVVDWGLCASVVNVTDSVLTVKNATKLDNSTKPINASDAQSNMKVRFADLKLKVFTRN